MGKNDTTMTILLTLSGVAALGGVGFLAYKALHKPAGSPAGVQVSPAGNVATSPTAGAPGSASNPIMTANPGFSNPAQGSYTLSDKPADIQAEILRKIQEQNEREALQRKNDKIFELKQQLNQCQNELKRLIDQCNNIDGQSVPQELVEAIKSRHVSDCEANTTWIFRPACGTKRDLSEGYDKILDDEWRKRKADLKRPLLTKMSELDSLQMNLIGNLKALGVDIPKVNPVPGGEGTSAATSAAGSTSSSGLLSQFLNGGGSYSLTGGKPPVYLS
ncbi:hypothetical protein [Deinococcus roseus]|uniref:Uncharacterized protein n=1 Tax=Deinococcus roseus TaxID=392414 RepID=A0ABQ2DGQ2_9DEIO|nr:hypothetical protein [Deinococcus roseus]GGJ56618.1 hypothetical protein GCM10008938_48460 [Deinococcus roseus]